MIHTEQKTTFAANALSDLCLSTLFLICQDQTVNKRCNVREINTQVPSLLTQLQEIIKLLLREATEKIFSETFQILFIYTCG